LEKYDSADQRFIPVPPEEIASDITIPPITYSRTLVVYLNKKRPLSEPKWCRTDSADEWLFEQFGGKKAGEKSGWNGKLQVIDPDPVRGRRYLQKKR
jgi:20S proteasome subunit alpha 6